ncbi:MAG: hypothetical protein ABIT20_19635 [Gemmatimonadaceae bacterium]
MSHRSNVRSVIGTLMLLAVTPLAANGQFGMLKKLKNSISPDSAARLENAKNDSIALAAKLAAGDTTPLGRSKFSRVVSAAGAASEKFEAVTGVSAKDAALAASGVGATNLIAKKMGVDPMSLGQKALSMRQQSAANRAAGAGVGGGGTVGIPGMPNMAEFAKMQQAASARMQTSPSPRGGEVVVGNPMMGGFTEADARAIAAFQQEMMQVAMAASGGDLAAQARLERWQAIALKYEPEIQKLSLTASGGDMASVQRLQVIQVEIIKEWVTTGSVKTVRVSKPAAKPVTKSAKPAKP